VSIEQKVWGDALEDDRKIQQLMIQMTEGSLVPACFRMDLQDKLSRAIYLNRVSLIDDPK